MKPRILELEYGYEGKLIWPPESPTHKVANKLCLVHKEDFDTLLAQAEAMAEALKEADKDILASGSYRQRTTVASDALSVWQKFKESL